MTPHRAARSRRAGQAMIEYAFLLLMAGMIAIGVLFLAGNTLKNVYQNLENQIGSLASQVAATPTPTDHH